MTRRPLCVLCLIFMISMCIADRAGLPLIRGNPVPENVDAWIEEHPQNVISGEVTQTTNNEFSQSVYLSNTYLIYHSQKISIENVKVFLKKNEDVPVGTVILVSGNLQRVEEVRNPGEFDSQQYYACSHIYYFLKKAEILKKSENYSHYRQALVDLKEYLKGILEKIGGKEAGIFQAIVLGDKSNLEDITKLQYQMSGIVHILAISGLHISVIGAGLYNLLMRTGMGIWPSGLISLVIMLQYGIMTGGSVSTMRAVSMFLILAGARITGRIYDLPTALAVSAMMILGESGAYLYSSSFLLSFCAVAGAGIVVPAVEKSGKKAADCGKVSEKLTIGIRKVVTALKASCIVSLIMLPVSLYFFGEVSVIGVFLNLIVLPTVGILLGCGVLGMFLGCVSIKIAGIAIFPGRMLACFYEKMCQMAGNLPVCTWIAGRPQIWQIVVYYLIMGSAVYLLTHRSKLLLKKKKEEKVRGNKMSAPNKIAVLLVAAGILVISWRETPLFSITCLDIGQGDAIVIRTPEENCFLVDGGSTNKSKTGQYQILPYLKNQGISRIDGIFISHTDADHISGIEEMLNLTVQNLNPVKINALYLPKWKNPPEAWEKLKKLSEEAKIPVYEVKNSAHVKAGKLCIKVLAPLENAVGTDVNEEGMVMQVEYENFTGLLTGDIGEEMEKNLLTKGLLEDIDFLKVGHHGSHYSTNQQFVDAIRPEYGIISCSKTNTYGHPSKEVVKRLKQAGCQLGFTMESGAVTIYQQDNQIWMEKYLDKKDFKTFPD